MNLNFGFGIGRSKTGDQLHKFTARIHDDGKVAFGGCNAHCNNHMHLRPVGLRDQKVEIKDRPGLFCIKCFGNGQVGREYVNATVVEGAR